MFTMHLLPNAYVVRWFERGGLGDADWCFYLYFNCVFTSILFIFYILIVFLFLFFNIYIYIYIYIYIFLYIYIYIYIYIFKFKLLKIILSIILKSFLKC
jgi:hypothetical protein